MASRHSLGASVDGALPEKEKERTKKRPRPDRLVPTPVPTDPTDWPTYSPTTLEGAPSKALRMIEREREKRREREEEEERRKREEAEGHPRPPAAEELTSDGASEEVASSPSAAPSEAEMISTSPSAPPSLAAVTAETTEATGTPSASPTSSTAEEPSDRPSAVTSLAPTASPSGQPAARDLGRTEYSSAARISSPTATAGCADLNGSMCKKSHSCVLLRTAGEDGTEVHECLPRPTSSSTTAVPTPAPTGAPAGAVGRPLRPSRGEAPSRWRQSEEGGAAEATASNATPAEDPAAGDDVNAENATVAESTQVRAGAEFDLTLDAPSLAPAGPPPPDGASKVTLTLGPDETQAPSEFSLSAWGLEGAEVVGRTSSEERHGGRTSSERKSNFSLSSGSLLGPVGEITSSGDEEGEEEESTSVDGASKVALSFSAGDAAPPDAVSDPGKKVSLSFALPSDETPAPTTASPSGEPTYLLFPTMAPTSAPGKKSKKKEEEEDTESPTMWPTTYLPTAFPSSEQDGLPFRTRFDPLSSEDWEGAELNPKGKVDLSKLYERRACPASRAFRGRSYNSGGVEEAPADLVEQTVEFAYALQSSGDGEDAVGTVQLHLLEDVALDLLGCHSRTSGRVVGGSGSGTARAEGVWYEEDRSVTAMRELFALAPLFFSRSD